MGAGSTVASQVSQIRFVLAAAYGSQRSGRPFSYFDSPGTTPISPKPEMTISIHPREGSACLSLSEEEYEELWQSFEGYYGFHFKEDLVKKLIFSSAGAQVRPYLTLDLHLGS